ncbi:hypothetical protein PIB30_018620 [Stylosanthes scabra]|uniref:Uncharacterized protein n=1 Tax=Stylosanthes scabra TaxID=79078 RepID=A0ABU6T7V0_9FABA|nr:hypothetical protein [Stylosanthes scabra]
MQKQETKGVFSKTQEYKEKCNKRNSTCGASTNDGTVTGILKTAPTTLSFEKRAKATTLSATSNERETKRHAANRLTRKQPEENNKAGAIHIAVGNSLKLLGNRMHNIHFPSGDNVTDRPNKA